MKKALKRMAAAALVTLSVLRGGDAFAQNAVDGRVVDANGAPLVLSLIHISEPTRH